MRNIYLLNFLKDPEYDTKESAREYLIEDGIDPDELREEFLKLIESAGKQGAEDTKVDC